MDILYLFCEFIESLYRFYSIYFLCYQNWKIKPTGHFVTLKVNISGIKTYFGVRSNFVCKHKAFEYISINIIIMKMLVNFYKHSSFQSLIAPSNEVLDVLHLAVSIIWKLIFAEFESGCKNNQSDRSEEEKMCDHLITAARRRDGVLVCIFLLGQKNPIWYWMFSNFAIINKAKLF